MAISERLAALQGRWRGSKNVFLGPGAPALESASDLDIGLEARGKFLRLRYTWTADGQPQEGLLLLGNDGERASGAWIDSWHNGDNLMVCRGTFGDGVVSVAGTYAAPPGPDWGWMIELRPVESALEVVMFNVPPGGAPELGVRARFVRVA
jgi:hypothetical protein